MKESFHRKCGPRQDLHFHLVCRLSRKLMSAESISLLFICTDCQRDFMRTSSFPCLQWKQSQFRGITQKRQLCFWHFILRANSHSWVGIYRLKHNKFVFKWSMFPNGTLLPSFSVENAIILWTNLKWNSQKTQPNKNGRYQLNTISPWCLVSKWPCFSLQTYLFYIERQWLPLGTDIGMRQAH